MWEVEMYRYVGGRRCIGMWEVEMYRYVGGRRCIGMWEVGDVSVCGR